MKNLFKIIVMTAFVMMWQPSVSEAGIFPGKKSGIRTSIKNQRTSVKLGKKNMKGLKKASYKVNARLSKYGR
jgi:hypothetical protein